jgi:hypothetical protein
MDRFDDFLSKYIPKYLENDFIDEIVITDENGNDAKKLNNLYSNNVKMKIYINKTKLGPFLNKINCCLKSSNEWIALIDSDNFAEEDYFKNMTEFIEKEKPNKTSILSPDHVKGYHFDWRVFSNESNVLNKETFTFLKKTEDNLKKPHNHSSLCVLFNLGNYVLNQYLVKNVNINSLQKLINESSSFDVILFNYLCFEQMNMNLFFVKNTGYIHNIHEGSIYKKTTGKNQVILSNNIYNSLCTLLSQIKTI